MGQALYRTHRPKQLSEVVGQEHITKTLEQALKQGRISHAYLFTGPRGVGKTTVARILAHEINGLPYADDNPHMDIIEIDAASNRRIDEIRELRERVYVAPTSAKYKVYIIDEVHMLTREAFNALLKTLEEPPAHVVFILATTDAHKLPETIISRTQRFSFKPGETAQLAAHLKRIAKAEKINISDEAIQLLAEHSEGSFRDSVSLLDQAGNQASRIEEADVRRLLGIPADEAIRGLLTAAIGGAETADLMQAITALYDQGYQAAAIAKQLGLSLRTGLAGGTSPYGPTLRLLGKLIEVPGSHDPERFLEIVLLSQRPPSKTVTAPEQPASATAKSSEVQTPAQVPEKPIEPAEPVAAAAKKAPKSARQPSKAARPLDAAIWPDILQALKQKHNTLYGVVRMAEPDFSEPGTLKLVFAFAFHQKRLNENANREKLADIVSGLTGGPVAIEVLHDKAATPPKVSVPLAETPPDDGLAAISNIFGNAELLES